MDGYKKNRDDLGLDLESWQAFIPFQEIQNLGYSLSEIVSQLQKDQNQKDQNQDLKNTLSSDLNQELYNKPKGFLSDDLIQEPDQDKKFANKKTEIDNNSEADKLASLQKEYLSSFEITENGVIIKGFGQTSRVSTALKWGLITPRILIKLLKNHYQDEFKNPFSGQEGPSHYISELIWREFYRYIQYHYPETQNIEFQAKFRDLDLADKISQDIFCDEANSIIQKLSAK
jgi:deoxyribodipyrimidine photolyase